MAIGARFDNAFKDLVRRNPEPLCRWLLGWPPENPLLPVTLPTEFAAAPMITDGLFEVEPNLIVHVRCRA